MASEPRTLTQRELNRAMLARQLLLERARLPLPRALERVGGIQAQYAPSMYIGLWSRLAGFERDALTRALERHSVVQGTLMRTTIHLVSARDYWPLALGVRDARREQWLRARPKNAGYPDGLDLSALAARLRSRLAQGPVPRKEIDALHGKGSPWTNGAGVWLDMLREPPSGTWERRRADLYALAERILGPPSASATEGVELLVRRYLGGFGPAAKRDIADWAGLPVMAVERALSGMKLRRFRDSSGEELVDLPRLSIPPADTPAPVRFLPVWDATLLVHARRTGILPEEHRPRVFNTKTPQSVNTFLVDGAVAGTWRYDKGGIATDPFRKLSRGVRLDLDEEAARLATFHA